MFIWGQYRLRYHSHQSLKLAWKVFYWNLPGANELITPPYLSVPGDDCSVPLTQGVWQQVDQNFPTLGPIAGRASHKTVVYDNKLWVASGDDFSHSHFQEMASFNFGTRMWQYHSSNSPSQAQPTQRYGHSLVAYRDKLYMFGGLKHNVITNELWEFDTRQHMWQLRHPVVAPRSSEEQQNEVIGVVGHTAHVIDDTMYAIFGHSPIYGYMNTVQECLLSKWNMLLRNKHPVGFIHWYYNCYHFMVFRDNLVFRTSGVNGWLSSGQQ